MHLSPIPSSITALLLLADGRFPAGAHVHSGGVEAAVDDGRITDLGSLEAFTAGRLRTTGLVEAALAAATAHRLATWGGIADDVLAEVDLEAEARIAAPPLRNASRRLGRQLLRSATRCWTSPVFDAARRVAPSGLHQAVALGAVANAVGIDAESTARLALHHAAATPTQAAVRLLGLDPFGAVAVCANLAGLCDELVEVAVDATLSDLAGLPSATSPLIEITAMEHSSWDTRMFAS